MIESQRSPSNTILKIKELRISVITKSNSRNMKYRFDQKQIQLNHKAELAQWTESNEHGVYRNTSNNNQ